MTFKARLTSKTNDQPSTAGVDFNEVDLMPGDVTVAIDYSTVNYKDARAVSGRAPVIRHYPGQPHAGQRARADALPRHGGGLRACTRRAGRCPAHCRPGAAGRSPRPHGRRRQQLTLTNPVPQQQGNRHESTRLQRP